MDEIRRRLRSSGDSPTAQVGVVVDELADLLTDTVPRLRELSRGLRNETEDTSRQVGEEAICIFALVTNTYHPLSPNLASGAGTIAANGFEIGKNYAGVEFDQSLFGLGSWKCRIGRQTTRFACALI